MCKCSQKNCDLEVFENSDKCILHCEKDDWHENVMVKGKFLVKINEFLEYSLSKEEQRKKDKDFWIQDSFDFVCEEYIFPEIDFGYFDNFKKISLYFSKCKFIGKTKFSNIMG